MPWPAYVGKFVAPPQRGRGSGCGLRGHYGRSGSTRWAEGDNSQKLSTIENRLLALAADLGDAAFHLHYDDYVADPASLRGLFEWHGEDFVETRVREVLHVRHSV